MAKEMLPCKQLMTVKQLAVYLQVKEVTIRRRIMKKTIPYYKMGKLVRFDPDKIQHWLEQQEVKV